MRINVAILLLLTGMPSAGCSSIDHCLDRCRRYATYKRQLAKARHGGTRTDLEAAFPSVRLSAPPDMLSGMPLRGTELYPLDLDFELSASFSYMDVRLPRRTLDRNELLYGRPKSTTYPLAGWRPFIHRSPKDILTGARIDRR